MGRALKHITGQNNSAVMTNGAISLWPYRGDWALLKSSIPIACLRLRTQKEGCRGMRLFV
jgi:hypothetical protein